MCFEESVVDLLIEELYKSRDVVGILMVQPYIFQNECFIKLIKYREELEKKELFMKNISILENIIRKMISYYKSSSALIQLGLIINNRGVDIFNPKRYLLLKKWLFQRKILLMFLLNQYRINNRNFSSIIIFFGLYSY